jgi:hypothetical protein
MYFYVLFSVKIILLILTGMRDLFYTILVVWVLWRIMSGINRHRSRTQQKKEAPPVNTEPRAHDTKKAIRKMADNEGEYVDFEDLK